MKNLKKMAEFAEANGKAIRPHAKTHKCPLVAKKQTAEGAVGVCVAKVSEALCMALAGVNSILILTYYHYFEGTGAQSRRIV